MDNTTYLSKSEDETLEIGSEFAKHLKIGDAVAFYGDLGAGKTEFIRGICRYFKVDELVTSPTFNIINQYFTDIFDDQEISIYHIDLYRIKNDAEFEGIGFSECLSSSDSIKLVEWSEKATNYLSEFDYSVRISIDNDEDETRIIEIIKLTS